MRNSGIALSEDGAVGEVCLGICLREGLGVERSDGWEVLSCCRGARCLLETVQLGEERVDVL